MKNEANLVDSDIIILCKNKMQNDKQKNSTLCLKKKDAFYLGVA